MCAHNAAELHIQHKTAGGDVDWMCGRSSAILMSVRVPRLLNDQFAVVVHCRSFLWPRSSTSTLVSQWSSAQSDKFSEYFRRIRSNFDEGEFLLEACDGKEEVFALKFLDPGRGSEPGAVFHPHSPRCEGAGSKICVFDVPIVLQPPPARSRYACVLLWPV